MSMKVWDRAGMVLATHGSAVGQVSAARHVTDRATQPVYQNFDSSTKYHPKTIKLEMDMSN